MFYFHDISKVMKCNNFENKIYCKFSTRYCDFFNSSFILNTASQYNLYLVSYFYNIVEININFDICGKWESNTDHNKESMKIWFWLFPFFIIGIKNVEIYPNDFCSLQSSIKFNIFPHWPQLNRKYYWKTNWSIYQVFIPLWQSSISHANSNSEHCLDLINVI